MAVVQMDGVMGSVIKSFFVIAGQLTYLLDMRCRFDWLNKIYIHILSLTYEYLVIVNYNNTPLIVLYFNSFTLII